MITIFEIAIRLVLVGATSLLFAIMFLAYYRIKNSKLLLMSIGFGFFVIYSLLAIPEVFGQPIIVDENLHLLLHLIALIFILVGTLKE